MNMRWALEGDPYMASHECRFEDLLDTENATTYTAECINRRREVGDLNASATLSAAHAGCSQIQDEGSLAAELVPVRMRRALAIVD